MAADRLLFQISSPCSSLTLTATNYGARIISLFVPQKNATDAEPQPPLDVVIGFDHPDKFHRGDPSFGATIGRVGNRTKVSDCKNLHIPVTEKERGNHLHGGISGFSDKIWEVKKIGPGGTALEFTYVSADGEEGYPGTLKTVVVYELTSEKSLKISYNASIVDGKAGSWTPVNLTNHTYFNLSGQTESIMTDHEAVFPGCIGFCPVDENLIPTGEIVKFGDERAKEFDFSEWRPVEYKAKAETDSESTLGAIQMKIGRGYDHNFAAKTKNVNLQELVQLLHSDSSKSSTQLLSSVRSTSSRIQMDVLSSESGVQFYTGNWLNHEGKNGMRYGQHAGFCLETQNFPDCVNKFDGKVSYFEGLCRDPVIRGNKAYASETVYKFSIF